MKRQPHIVCCCEMSVNQAPAVIRIRLDKLAISDKNGNDILFRKTFFDHVSNGVYFNAIAACLHERPYFISQILQNEGLPCLLTGLHQLSLKDGSFARIFTHPAGTGK
jgi:hypothetical protein